MIALLRYLAGAIGAVVQLPRTHAGRTGAVDDFGRFKVDFFSADRNSGRQLLTGRLRCGLTESLPAGLPGLQGSLAPAAKDLQRACNSFSHNRLQAQL